MIHAQLTYSPPMPVGAPTEYCCLVAAWGDADGEQDTVHTFSCVLRTDVTASAFCQLIQTANTTRAPHTVGVPSSVSTALWEWMQMHCHRPAPLGTLPQQCLVHLGDDA